MLPGRSRERVTLATVLSWFFISDKGGLFPCPQKMLKVEKPVPRDVAKQAANLLVQGVRVLCLHGPGGCGKTTTLQQLADFLPQGSYVELYDCFGGGRYRFADDKRHLPEKAFLQIANDLAVKTRTPFFLPRDSRQPADIGRFLKRLNQAATAISSAQNGALLVVVIDAADNSVTAAENSKEACFVHNICQSNLQNLPSNVQGRVELPHWTARCPQAPTGD